MQLVNPALILLLIPLFDAVIYPFCAKFNFMVKPLQRMTVGGLLTAAAFLISGFLELHLMETYDRLPKLDESHVHLMNSLACPISARISDSTGQFNQHRDIGANGNVVFYDLRPGLLDLDIRIEQGCQEVVDNLERLQFEAKDQKVLGLVVRGVANQKGQVVQVHGDEEPKKTDNGNSRIRVVFDLNANTNQSLYLRPQGSDLLDADSFIQLPASHIADNLQVTEYKKVPPNYYE